MTAPVLTDLKKHITPKGVARFVVANSVRFVVTSAIVALVPTESKTEKVKLIVGSYVVAQIVADKAKDYVSDEIDDIVETVNELQQAPEIATETVTPNP